VSDTSHADELRAFLARMGARLFGERVPDAMTPAAPAPRPAAPSPPRRAATRRAAPLPAPLVYDLHKWPLYRRLEITGSENPNHRTGRYARYRRHRLEQPLIHMLGALHPASIVKRLPRLRPDQQDELSLLLGWLTGDCHPSTWALQHRGGGFYVPRIAWAFCAAWLLVARQALRLISLAPALIVSTMPSLLKERIERSETGARRAPQDELRRYRAWCASQSLAL